MRYKTIACLLLLPMLAGAQMKWICVDSLYLPLPSSFHVYISRDSINGKPNIAYYVSVALKDRSLEFTTQVSKAKRITPAAYYQQEGKPLLVMNGTFFDLAKSTNLNLVMKDHQLLAYQVHSLAGRAKDTLTYKHPFGSAIGIFKNRQADIAWLYTDSLEKFPFASQDKINFLKDSTAKPLKQVMLRAGNFKKWKVQTAIGGGPVLVQKGEIDISNNEELKFAGKAIEDKHPRSAMGYTADGKLILLVIEGRFPGKAEGATLIQEAQMLKEIGCIEALNLDGGGSSCLLINGKQTIQPSDKEGERPVPAVFLIKN
ncbi:MAG: hypothetical protein RLZZ28_873 [Bacteroidota bacterium]|jgi:hypothetical protein